MPAPLLAGRTGRQWRRVGPLWGNRDFMLLWSGQTASVLGTQASALAFPLLVLELTQSPTKAGVVGFAAGLPVLVCQLPAGALVDRWDRRTVMISCDLGRLLIIASIPAVGSLVGISPVLAVVAQTRRALLAPSHLLGRIYSVNLMISGSTAPLGPLLAGFLLSWLGGAATCAMLGGGLLVIAATATASPTIRHADLPTAAASPAPSGRT